MQLGLSRFAAARQLGVNRKTWSFWESDERRPDDRHHAAIEQFCGWEQGSVAAVRAGRLPRLLREGVASVTPIRAEVPADEAELAAEWRDMGLPEPFVAELLDAYRAEKAGLYERFRHRPRQTGT